MPETVTLLLLAGLFYLFSCYLSLRNFDGIKSNRFAAFAVAAGIVFRLTVWPLAPALSDDPYRYRWEGKLQTAGGNPYLVRPADAQWSHLRDTTFPRVVGKDFKAVYGPLIEQLELWTYRAVSAATPDPGRQVFWFKLPFALFDLGTIAAVWWMLGVHGLPRQRVLIYAWSPLTVIEFWATGHNDSLVVLAVVLALGTAARGWWTWCFTALSVAVAAKIWPILLFPLFIGWKRNLPERWYQWWPAIPVLGILALPYRGDVVENFRFAGGFVGGWRNNDSLFGLILWIADDIHRAKYIAFALVAASVVILTVCRVPLERAALAAIAILLMVASNCHSWYLTWILPLLALVPVPALLLWTALVPLAYSAVISWVALGEWNGSTALRWYEYGPVYALLIGSWLVSWLRGRRKLLRNSARIPE